MATYWILWILVCVLMLGVWLVFASFKRRVKLQRDEEELDKLLEEILRKRDA